MTNKKYSAIKKGDTILVTGATGFIGAWVVLKLLNDYKVKLVIRDESKYPKLKEIFGAVDYAVCNIDDLDSLKEAVNGCQGVIHLASPFTFKVNNYEEELMKPAVEGTTTILKACLHSEVKRIVITSSFAAIYDAAKGLQPHKVYTEKEFSPLTYEDGVNAKDPGMAYRASKSVAEKAAWDFIKQQDANFDISVICPSMVFGPLYSTTLLKSLADINSSNAVIWSLVNASEIPPTKAPLYVDVRDVADAHVNALVSENASNSRYLVSAGDYDTQEIADILRLAKFKNIPAGTPGQRISGTHFKGDSSKAVKDLGIQFRPLDQSVIELCHQLLAYQP